MLVVWIVLAGLGLVVACSYAGHRVCMLFGVENPGVEIAAGLAGWAIVCPLYVWYLGRVLR